MLHGLDLPGRGPVGRGLRRMGLDGHLDGGRPGALRAVMKIISNRDRAARAHRSITGADQDWTVTK